MMVMACASRLVGRDVIEAERGPIVREPQTACPNPATRDGTRRNIISRDGESAGRQQLGRPASMAASDTGAWAKQIVWRAS